MNGKVKINEEVVVSEKNYDIGSLTVTIGSTSARLHMYILDSKGLQVGSEATDITGGAYDNLIAQFPDLLKTCAKLLFADKFVDVDIDDMSDGETVVGDKLELPVDDIVPVVDVKPK